VQALGDEENIGFASYTITGQQVRYLENVPAIPSTPGGTKYFSPHIIGLAGNRVFLSFARDTGTTSIGYLVLDSSGNYVAGPFYLSGVGDDPAAIQFSNGTIFLAWLNLNSTDTPGTQQVAFVTINPSSYAASGSNELPIPFGLEIGADDLSVTQDLYGNAVITWVDLDTFQRIYYALVGNDGNEITPPIQIFDSQGKDIKVSQVGASNAAYIGKFHLFMHAVLR
jgi:hypothetical protein